jgi:hypothetical protein
MPVYDSLDSRQTNARALEILGTVKSLKNSKQFIIVPHVETDTVVLHIIYVLIPIDMTTHFNKSGILILREFDGIGKKVQIHLFNERPVSLSGRHAVDFEIKD